MEKWAAAIAGIRDLVWGVPAMTLLMGVGILLSVLWGFPQLPRRSLGEKAGFGKDRKSTRNGRGDVSSFKALCTALAASIGTGNIAGVAGAIALGGPGAVFWMWLSAFFGMGTKYVEVTLAVRYRRKASGGWTGGPMYYIVDGLGQRWRWLAELFSALGALAALGIGNMVQGNTVAAVITQAVTARHTLAANVQRGIALGAGILCGVLAYAALTGGAKRIGEICSLLVPCMAGIYVLAALGVIAAHANALPQVFRAIFQGAFNPAAVAGGLAGTGMRTALSQGIGRGVFSNEAGLGSAPMAYAAVETDSPESQGRWGVREVFMDTFVVCTMTALVVLLGVGVESIPYGTDHGAALTVTGFASLFGGGASLLVAACLCLFALSTLLAWGLYGVRCWEFLFNGRGVWIYPLLFAAFTVIGAVMRLDLVWNFSGAMNGLMALPNLTALLLLSLGKRGRRERKKS